MTARRSADNANRGKEQRRRDRTTRCRRSGGLAALAAAALGLAACAGGHSTPHVASLQTTTTLATSTSGHSESGGSTATTLPKGNATALVDGWAACERSHGDPNQADPIIDAYGVINIITPGLHVDAPTAARAMVAGDPQDVTGTCSQYLAAAQNVLRAANPVPDPQGPSQAQLLQYVGCMRANGVPNYPDPQGNTTDFIGTGVDPNSPFVENANKVCGDKLRLPAWWIAGTGPPGDISVGMAGVPGSPPPGIPVTGGNGGAGTNSGSGAGG
jgi:hypothetical protein